MADTRRTVELVQAILIASFWYRPPKNQIHIAIDRHLNLAVSIAEELGISSSESALSIASADQGESISSSDAWRTWSLCYLLSAGLSSCLRISPKVLWNSDLEMKLSSLEYSRDLVKTDILLCQFVRAERLCQQIIMEAGYNGSGLILDVTDDTRMRWMQNLITDRKAQVFSSLKCPSLTLYNDFATLFLHECILHTPTNDRSFAAPYVAERLSMADFPAPIVTSHHINSLYTLRDTWSAFSHNTFSFPFIKALRAPKRGASLKAET